MWLGGIMHRAIEYCRRCKADISALVCFIGRAYPQEERATPESLQTVYCLLHVSLFLYPSLSAQVRQQFQ
jgi:hypothetical protein